MKKKRRIGVFILMLALTGSIAIPAYGATGKGEYYEPTIPPELLPTSVPKWTPTATPAVAVPPVMTAAPVVTPVPTYAPIATPDVTVPPAETSEPIPSPDELTEEEQKEIDSFCSKKVKKVTCDKSVEKKVRLTWQKQDGATGYRIYRSLKKSSGYKLKATKKKTKFIDKKAGKRKTYYYKVQAIKEYKNKQYTGKKSKARSVYVTPKTPCTVIAGECFVEGMRYVSNQFPKNIHLVAKIGVNTYTMQNNNYFTYQGRSITGLERIAYYNPDRVYFLIGANESAWTTPSFTMKNYKQMVELLRKINKHVEIVLMKIPPFGYSSSQNIPSVSARASFNKAYREYAKSDKKIYYCNATDVLDDGSSHLLKKYDDGDGCHWNTSGTIAVIGKMKEWSKDTFGNW